ncbi:LysR family transcriptional regulator [Amycolatopsis ultiminotia]|uniref:LysR family transcriptional regulator n=1 Tax=Amycolatopsis ultiminotia TaxID=543629 RepID=A0ABP6YHL7_9PSEU
MNEWSRIDLNLLIPLNALLLERNVTKAAERLAVAQPTMSTALARLRRHFDDPLLVREGRGFVLTPFAESLRLPLQRSLSSARAVLTSGLSFDPATDRRHFTILADDYASCVLLRPALLGITRAAPGLEVSIRAQRTDPVDQLRSRRCDLLLWPLQLPLPGLLDFPHAVLLTDELVVAADPANAAVPDELTAAELAALPAIGVAGIGEHYLAPEPGPGEQVLRRQTPITVEDFPAALHFVAGTELVTLAHRRLFDRIGPSLGLRAVPLVPDPPKLTLAMFWHPREVRTPSHQWLRARLEAAAAAL